jgi:sugar O-acyltransferase (sialic acid O-acetyltransferase NeuD family)
MKKNIVIFGGGSHCLCILDVIETSKEFNIVGIIDSLAIIGSEISGYKVIGRQNQLSELVDEYSIEGGVVAIGDNYLRSLLVQEVLLQLPNFNFVNIIHPSAVISRKAKLGVGNVIMPGVIVNVGAIIKNHCIINTGSQLEHFSIMEDYSSLSAGVITGGYAVFKEFSAIALGVTVFDRITVGFNTVVGSGSLITKDLPDNVLAFGVPARIVRERKLEDKFLK